MFSVTVKISGTAEELQRLRKLGDKLNDFSDVYKPLGAELKQYYGGTNGVPGNVFASQGGALGKVWAALSPVYKSWKGKHYPNKGTLQASGKLMQSFRATNTRTTLTIDNTDPKFIFHQLGTGIGSNRSKLSLLGGLARAYTIGGMGRGRGIPARPMLAITPEVETMVKNAIKSGVDEKLKGV